MHNFTAADSILLLIYIVFIIGIGISVRSTVTTTRDFFLGDRAVPAWICVLAFVGVSLGGPELVGISALGAKYGLVAAQFYGIGAIPAMLFLGLYMIPVYYGSGARSVPDYLRLRFDAKTCSLSACMFLVITIFCAGLSFCVLVRIIQVLHFFDDLSPVLARSPQVAFAVTVSIASVMVLAYIIPGGLAAAMYNQAVQFCLVTAALLPVVFLGLKNIGGWSGLKTTLLPQYTHEWSRMPNSIGVGVFGIIAGLGLVLGFSYWCVDFSILQAVFASRDVESARRVPIIAAIPKMFLPFLVVVPAMIAIALPTPHTTTTVTTTPEGAIIHNIQVVQPEVEQGKGIVPARLDPRTHKPLVDGEGHSILDFNAAIPSMFLHFFPTGILGLGLAALLAAFMSGMAANITAFSNVFTCDLFQPYFQKRDDDRRLLRVGRIATGVAVVVSIAMAYALIHVNNYIFALQLIFSIVNAPMLAPILLGMFSRRTTGHGAFSGLLAGVAAAVVHHGLTLANGLPPGIDGGWILGLHRYPSEIAQVCGGAIFAFVASFFITVIVSRLTTPRSSSELVGLVHAAPDHRAASIAWRKSPEALAVAILVVAIVLNIFLA